MRRRALVASCSPMKFLLLLAIVFALIGLARTARAQSSAPAVDPAEAAARVRAGKAVLIDVREPSEWEAGVAAPAYLLPLSDLRGPRRKWQHVLESAKAEGKEVLLYCRTGNRSGQAAAVLAQEGYPVGNVGGFRDWSAAGLPTRTPDEPAALP